MPNKNNLKGGIKFNQQDLLDCNFISHFQEIRSELISKGFENPVMLAYFFCKSSEKEIQASNEVKMQLNKLFESLDNFKYIVAVRCQFSYFYILGS